jgi:hypothetical protein
VRYLERAGRQGEDGGDVLSSPALCVGAHPKPKVNGEPYFATGTGTRGFSANGVHFSTSTCIKCFSTVAQEAPEKSV